jgi:hypothetical protein
VNREEAALLGPAWVMGAEAALLGADTISRIIRDIDMSGEPGPEALEVADEQISDWQARGLTPQEAAIALRMIAGYRFTWADIRTALALKWRNLKHG